MWGPVPPRAEGTAQTVRPTAEARHRQIPVVSTRVGLLGRTFPHCATHPFAG